MELQSLRERLKMRITSELDLAQEMADEDIGRMIDRCIAEETKGQYVPLKEKVGLRVELFNSLRRLDVLTELLEDESVTEIMVNSVSDIFVERGGTLTRFEKGFSSEERLEAVIQHIVGDCNRRINAANPIVDARLVDGSRVCVVTRPISLGGPIITIRRFPKQRITMEKLIAMGSLDAGTAAVLQILVQAGIIKTRVPLKNLRLTDQKPKEKKKAAGGHRTVTKKMDSAPARNEVDVRGMNLEEALMEVDAFIDHALMHNLNMLTIIHGKGTGILRNGIQQHLRRHKAVKSFRLGVYGEGESGVTIVELK